MHLAELKAKTPTDLLSLAEELEVENASSLRKQDMMFAILKAFAEKVISAMRKGFGGHIEPPAAKA